VRPNIYVCLCGFHLFGRSINFILSVSLSIWSNKQRICKQFKYRDIYKLFRLRPPSVKIRKWKWTFHLLVNVKITLRFPGCWGSQMAWQSAN
jgi:hypothetical protein